MPLSDRARGIAFGLAAAALFGLSTPVAKALLEGVRPLALAGLLYLGGGIAVAAIRLRRPRRPLGHGASEAALRPADAGLLAGIVLAGGIAAPLLMLFGLGRVSAVAGSLLLNLEAPATALLAVALFGEHLSRREITAAGLVFLGASLLQWGPGELRIDAGGVLAIAAACLFWALDNNLTQRLTLRDPVAVVRFKMLAAGGCNLALAGLAGDAWPGPELVATALAVGAASYGFSVLLDTWALRLLGAAREAACFATAPFFGAILSVAAFGDRFGVAEALAALAMASGVAVLLRDRHSHEHLHEALVHDHRHDHDEHHDHAHAEGTDSTRPHAHLHAHDPLRHAHPHVSDAHHRHRHR